MRLGRFSIAFGLVAGTAMGIAFVATRNQTHSERLVTGKFIAPTGDQIEVGSFPINMKLSPDGRFIVVSNCGFREQLSVIDATTGALLSKKEFVTSRNKPNGLYFGLAFGSKNGENLLYVSRGSQDLVTTYTISPSGTLKEVGNIKATVEGQSAAKNMVAGIAPDGDITYAVFNHTYDYNKTTSVVGILGNNGTHNPSIPVGGYPFDIALAKRLGEAGKLYVSNERDGSVSAIDLKTQRTTEIKCGANSTSLVLNADQSKVYVSNSCGDTVSVIDTKTDRVVQTILLRIGDLGSIPGTSPLGLALSKDEKTLFVAMYDLNAVAVVDAVHGKVKGFIPVGWGPTSVVVSGNEQRLFVSNAKGTQTKNPNDKPVRSFGQYHPNILEGTVSVVDLPSALSNLDNSTKVVLSNNLAVGNVERANRQQFVNPGIDHVVYIIKENRTYDQVLGDVKRGNGDASICLFPEKVTPNQHALANRFLLLDNFYVCAEVSYDGWAWSTQGMANPYVERNVVYNYSGRGGSYDSEGENGGVPVDLHGLKDVARTPNGYIWDQCLKQNVTYRNYGFFLTGDESPKTAAAGPPFAKNNTPSKKALLGHTNTDFLQFDTSYADSDAWVKYGLKPAPNQMATYGSQKDPSRVSVWMRDFNQQVKTNSMPRFTMLRLMRDHTAGTSPGIHSPRAMVADNDYAVGQVVDAISHSPYWKRTVICVLEDDAQAGFDHVDCHRSPAYVISPWIEKATASSQFYNTDSMIRTMELLLGLKPLNQYDAVASPINVFNKRAQNDEPFNAILPAKSIIGEINEETAYRAKDSAKLIAKRSENSASDVELNDILWGAIKGAKTPRPAFKGAQWKSMDRD